MSPQQRLGRDLGPSGRAHGSVSVVLRTMLVMAGTAALTVPYFLACLALLPWRGARLRLGNLVGGLAGRWVHFVVGIRHEIVGELPERVAPAIYVQNHGGSVDLWLAMQLCPAPGSGTVKRDILWVPFVGLGYLLSGHLILDREDRQRAIGAMAAIERLVDRHRISIWILPEGTRSKDGRLGTFKKGFAHLALATGLPIVPVVVHRAYEFWPKGLQVRPGTLTVEILPPVSTQDWSRDRLDEHVAEIRAVFARHLGEHG